VTVVALAVVVIVVFVVVVFVCFVPLLVVADEGEQEE
jgi:hypothetical protein